MTQKTKVFIIDDEREMLEALSTLLTNAGYEVYMKPEAEGCLSEIKQENPDIIIIDYLLSGTDGGKITKELKRTPEIKDIPVVIISAHPQGESVAKEAGANGFLGKPFDIKALRRTIEESVLSPSTFTVL